MKFKTRKILIICLIATLAISMISAVSAEEGESKYIGADPKTPGGLERSVNMAMDGEIILLKNGVYTIDKELYISESIKFKGGSNVIFEGKGKGQIYISSTAGKVSFEKITFKNFKKSPIFVHDSFEYGSAKLTVNKCKFSNNKAVVGGAIHGVNLRISDCTFTNNKADLGGAIASDYLVINDCTFSKNQAIDGSGGAIYSGKVTMNKCTFTSNQAKSTGGAIYADFAKSSKITNSKFTKNTAKTSGGAIYTSKMNVNKCTFTSNKAVSECGGAIFVEAFKATIANSKFYKNIAGKKYNAIEGKVTLKNIKITPKDGTKVKK